MSREAGLTLLEMLLVVFILSVVSLGAVALVESKEDALRLDETRGKLRQLRTAITGRSVFADEAGSLAGYVADVGALPVTVEDLVRPPADAALAHAVREPAFDATTLLDAPAHRLPKGWRGPYLTLPPSNDPYGVRFRDGWGNGTRTDPDHGWLLVRDGANLTLASVGPDGVDATGDEVVVEVPQSAWQVNVNGWSVTVTGLSATDTNLFASLLIWTNGTWERIDSASADADDGGSAALVFAEDRWVPIGRHLLVLGQTSGTSEAPFERGGAHVALHVRLRAREDLPPVTMEVR